MLNRTAYENSMPDGISVLEIVSGPEDQPRQFVPLKRTEVRGEVAGPLASLRLLQVFGFSREQRDQVLEAVYRFPLPGDAAITAVRVRFGAVEIQTELREREEAEAAYEEAKREGRQAALVSRESPDVFTLRVAGIQPDQEVTVETTYAQLVRSEGTGWSLRIPLTTAPRYVRSDELTSRHAQGQPLALLRDPGHRFSLDLKLSGAEGVASPTHALDVSPEDESVRVRLKEGEVVPDRDCVLTWRPPREESRPSFRVWLHEDQKSEQAYFLALVAPPAVPEPGPGIAREIILLVDHSGSMGGAKWEAADWAVKRFLSELTEQDRFGLGLFHNTTRWFSPQLQSATPDTVEKAVRFLEEHRDSGGTELGVALEQALHLQRAEGEAARHVLVVTDAEVSDAARILRLADEEAKRPDRRRISVLCIDAAPNSFLALELAERGGGVARFLTSDPGAEDITTALDEVLADWAQPVLTGLRLEVNRPEAQAAGREVRSSGEGQSVVDLADLPAGRAIWAVGRVPRDGTEALAFRVLAADGREVKARRPDLSREGHDLPALKALFGARRIVGLEYLMHSGYAAGDLADQLRRLGYDPDRVLASGAGTPAKVYAENTRSDAEAALRKVLVEESLSYGLVSSETAFVAVRTESGKPVEETVVVANALPAGWDEGFLGYGVAASAATMGPFGAVRAAPPNVHAMYLSAPVQVASKQRFRGAARDSSVLHDTLPMPLAAAPATPAAPDTVVLFAGVPVFEGTDAVLYDSSRTTDAGKLAENATFSRLTIRFPDGDPKPDRLDRGLEVLIFVGDLAQPRARVRLADLVRQGGERPLNLRRGSGQPVRIVLVDPAGAWSSGTPPLEVALG